MSDLAVYSFAVISPYIFAGGWDFGVYKRPISEMITSVNKLPGVESPKSFSIEQNYPNPFNPGTIIKFSLPKSSHVTLSIYNSMGQEVSKLISQDLEAGIHTTKWNAAGFPSGV